MVTLLRSGVVTLLWWVGSLCSGIRGHFTPEMGGQLQRFFHRGYKFDNSFSPLPTETHYNISGIRLDPNTNLSVSRIGENWLGYFLPYPCHVEDAFRKCWDDIKVIKTQDWSMVRLTQGGSFLSYPQNPYIYDADMVIVEMFENATFKWDEPTIPILLASAEEPQHFSYTEEMDYVPVVVELDPNDPAEEIGVFVNDECQGASIVTGDVTTVNAYILDESSNGEPIEIQTWSPSKDGGKTNIHKEYYVYNPETGTSSKTDLVKNDNWSFYYLPLKSVNTAISEFDNVTDVSVYPNPASDIISYDVNYKTEDYVTVTLHEATGALIVTLESGKVSSGNKPYTFNIKDHTKSKGIFYLRINGINIQATEKIIVL